jgi:hypothetical protein
MGHLSNEVARNFIREFLDSRTSTLILGHLSEREPVVRRTQPLAEASRRRARQTD